MTAQGSNMSLDELGRVLSKPWQEKNINAIMNNFSEDLTFVDRALNNTEHMNREEYQRFAETILDCCDDTTIEPRAFIKASDGKTVVMENEMHCKFVKDAHYFPAKARGQTIRSYGSTISQIEDGKTKECHQYATYSWD